MDKPLISRKPLQRAYAILGMTAWVVMLIGIGLCWPWTVVRADRIILKNGAVEESDRIWESGNYVHFILKGTKTVEIRYSREIVERIERDKKAAPTAQPPGKSGALPAKTPVKSVAPATSVPSVPAQKQLSQSSADRSSVSVDTYVERNKGISFYDPRRPERYWADRNSKHAHLNGAISALSKLYGRPAQWIADHMGEENDLGVIHRKLQEQLAREEKVAGAAAGDIAQDDSFYSAERPLPYCIGGGHCFKTRSEALSELAQQYHKPLHWIEQNMGNDPHVALMRQALSRAAAAAGDDDAPVVGLKASGSHTLRNDLQGIRFYNPRRTPKYLIDRKTGFDTLREALDALADQYGVSENWIENHMGDTNTLSEIHANIQKSAK